jgi:hypothetical protein
MMTKGLISGLNRKSCPLAQVNLVVKAESAQEEPEHAQALPPQLTIRA